MTDDDFLQAIAAEPDSGMHRLVYADWLEERGDKRAEFLRLDHELQTANPEDETYAAKESRWLDLWERIDPDWMETLFFSKNAQEELRLISDLLVPHETPVIADYTESIPDGYFFQFGRKTVDDFFLCNKLGINRVMCRMFLSLNRDRQTPSQLFGSDSRFVFLSWYNEQSLIENGSWQLYWEQWPDLSGLHRISRAGFSPDLTQALVYLGMTNEYEEQTKSLVACVKSDGKWQRDQQIHNIWTS